MWHYKGLFCLYVKISQASVPLIQNCSHIGAFHSWLEFTSKRIITITCIIHMQRVLCLQMYSLHYQFAHLTKTTVLRYLICQEFRFCMSKHLFQSYNIVSSFKQLFSISLFQIYVHLTLSWHEYIWKHTLASLCTVYRAVNAVTACSSKGI